MISDRWFFYCYGSNRPMGIVPKILVDWGGEAKAGADRVACAPGLSFKGCDVATFERDEVLAAGFGRLQTFDFVITVNTSVALAFTNTLRNQGRSDILKSERCSR